MCPSGPGGKRVPLTGVLPFDRLNQLKVLLGIEGFKSNIPGITAAKDYLTTYGTAIHRQDVGRNHFAGV